MRREKSASSAKTSACVIVSIVWINLTSGSAMPAVRLLRCSRHLNTTSSYCRALPGRCGYSFVQPPRTAYRGALSAQPNDARTQQFSVGQGLSEQQNRRSARCSAREGALQSSLGSRRTSHSSDGDDTLGGSQSNWDPVFGAGQQMAEPSTVYFVATPIGNLEDMTVRAANILRTADVIAAEDTRTTGSLLKLLGVERQGKMISHHEHNTKQRVPVLIEAAREGKSVAVVCDAGTPGFSDPGRELAAACAAEGVRAVPIPGACAASIALSVSGFLSREFVFFGFIPGKRGSAVRKRKLAEIARESRTSVIYEAPHRLAETLGGLLEASIFPEPSRRGLGEWSPNASDSVAAMESREREEDEEESGHGRRRDELGGTEGCAEGKISGEGDPAGNGGSQEDATAISAAGSRPVMIARELTKFHEEIYHATLAEAASRYGWSSSGSEASSKGAVVEPKGEFTIILGPGPPSASGDEGSTRSAMEKMAVLEARLMELTAGGMTTSSAVKMAAKDLGMRKSEVYRVALALPGIRGDSKEGG